MIVECPQCKGKAKVDESRIGPHGVKVRCAKCRHIYPIVLPKSEATFSDKTSLYNVDTITGEMLTGEFVSKSRPKMPLAAPDADATSVGDPAFLDTDRPRIAPGAGAHPADVLADADSAAFTAPVLRVALEPEVAPEPTRSLRRPSGADLAGAAPVAAVPNRRTLPGAGAAAGESTRTVEPRSVLLARTNLPRAQRRGRLLGAAALVTLALGMAIYLTGERLYVVWRQRLGSVPVARLESSPMAVGVSVAALRSLLYPLANSHVLLLVVGEARAAAAAPAEGRFDAVLELRDRTGKVAAMGSAPLGLALDLGDLVRLSEPGSWEALVQTQQRLHPAPALPAGGTAPFRIALLDPPLPVEDYAQVLHLAPTAPLPPAAAPAPAPPAAQGLPPPAVPTVVAKDLKAHAAKPKPKSKVHHHNSAHRTADD